MTEKVTTLRPKKDKAIEESSPFGCGCVVALKSGGPAMTVRMAIKAADGLLMLKTDWMDAAGQLMAADFYAAQLMRVEHLPDEDSEPERENETCA